MVFRINYFEESHHILLQIEIAKMLQTKILQSLYQKFQVGATRLFKRFAMFAKKICFIWPIIFHIRAEKID